MKRVAAFIGVCCMAMGVQAQQQVKTMLRAMDTGGTARVLRQPDSRLIFFTATGGNFYSDRIYANGDKDDAYNGIRTSKTLFKELGQCHTRTAVLDKWSRVLIGGDCRAGGKRTATLVRLNKMGDLDQESEGMVQTVVGDSGEINALCVLPDEKIIAAGTYYASGVARFYLSKHIYNGARDNTFGTNGVRIDSDMPGGSKAVAAVTLWDGKIIVCGYNATDKECNMLLVRYNTDGGRDYSYGTDGIVATQRAEGTYMLPKQMLLLADGKLLVTGTYATKGNGQEIFVAKYTKEGKADTAFGAGGMVRLRVTGEDYADDMALLEDSTIIISGIGKARGQILLRLSGEGVADSTWGYGSAKGIRVPQAATGANSAAYSIAVSPLDSRVYSISEMLQPNATETMIYLRGFLQNNDLGIVDMADKKKQYLVYPIPIKKSVKFDYELVDSQYVTVKMYNMTGNETAMLVNNKMMQEGEHTFAINFPEEIKAGRYDVVFTTSEGYKTTIEITKQ